MNSTSYVKLPSLKNVGNTLNNLGSAVGVQSACDCWVSALIPSELWEDR